MTGTHEDAQPAGDPRIARTRRQVLEAARQLILEEGQEAVTPTRLAEMTGIARSTIYRQWSRPSEIVFEATGADTDAPPFTPTGDPVQDLTSYLEALRSMLGSPQGALTATQIDRAEHSDEAAELLGRVAASRRELIAALLDEDPAAFGDFHALVIGPLMFERYFSRRPISDELIRLVVDAYLRTRPTSEDA